MQDPEEPIFATNACYHTRPTFAHIFIPQVFKEAPPAAKPIIGLYVGLRAVILGGGVAYYLYDSSSEMAEATSTALKSATQSAKVATNFVPTKEDYQKDRSF
ncbi:hypothetical protein EV702DRAFT_1198956 [Suillus placidus]|uniref:Uncharacterized protein n=1 Tax=Suillus placidus TaxID=48579 RepID=A0A9P7D273_9AGAM|nr:hypothetical protein EV702DRAFT_1198956 [Suillus placidus]